MVAMDRELKFYEEKLTFYRLLLTIGATGFYGIVSWLFISFDAARYSRLFTAVCGFILAAGLILIAVFKIRFYTNKIRGNND